MTTMMELHRLVIMTCMVLVFHVSAAYAQWTIDIDSTYGNNGLSVDPSIKPLDSDGWPEVVYILSDGSLIVVRDATNQDTSIVVSRMLPDGLPDLQFDTDGMMFLKEWTHPLDYALSPDELLWHGRMVDGRFELSEVDRNGNLRTSLIWRDTASKVNSRLVAVRPDGTLILRSTRRDSLKVHSYIRFVEPGAPDPVSDVFVPDESLPKLTMLIDVIADQYGRVIKVGASSDSTYAIVRHTVTGVWDSTFGNANGHLEIENPGGDFSRFVSYRALRAGGYSIVFIIYEHKTEETFIRVVKIDDSGIPIPTFGNNGVLDIRGPDMQSRGIVECPNGDLLLLTYATNESSRLYQIRPDGSLIPRAHGDHDTVRLVRLIRLYDDGVLYALSADPMAPNRKVVSRNRVGPVTTVNEQHQLSPLDISIDHDVITVKGAGTTATVRVYSLVGRCVFEQQCDAYGSVTLPSVMSGTYVVSASTEQDVKSTVVNIVR